MLKFLNPLLNHGAWGLSKSFTRSFSELSHYQKIRNIGISAHIDSGKTTFSQRVLFYAGKINSIHEVKGSDSVGATMDFMELEREKGITIQSAATHLKWRDYNINLIDTPGHVDFTIQVERALRVLDGAILILCGVGGVQPQTLTVNKQMLRYNVPRIIFVNKLDRMGANPWSAIESAKAKLGLCCAAVQIPIGEDDRLKGLIDIVKKKAYYFDGPNGETIREEEVPSEYKKLMQEKQSQLFGQLANLDTQLQQMFLEQKKPSEELIQSKIRQYTLERKFIPVFMGSAYKNKGVQLALDGVLKYLPSPLDKKNYGYILNKEKKEEMVELITDQKKPFVGYVFKLEENKFGQLTYIRVYQGKLKRGQFVWNDKLGKKLKVSRIVKMHANNMEEVESVKAGDIFAIFGVDCSTGDTLSQADNSFPVRCQSMFVPDPVMSLTIKPLKQNEGAAKLEKALSKFKREDPTFRVNVDKQSEEMIISGMGELHLQIYVQRINREFGVQCSTGQPGVNYRETITQRQPFDYLHKKQTGGAGQYARVIGYIEPIDPEGNETRNQFVSKVVGTNIPPEYVTAVGKAFYDIVQKGPQTGYPVINTRFVLEDGATHSVDSSANAFAIATRYAFHKAMVGANQQVLEPLMDVQINVHKDIYQKVMAGITKRNGSVTKTETKGDLFCLKADVALREMFGYAMQLRGLTSGEGEFSMEYKKHTPMPAKDAQVAMAKYKAKKKLKQI